MTLLVFRSLATLLSQFRESRVDMREQQHLPELTEDTLGLGQMLKLGSIREKPAP